MRFKQKKSLGQVFLVNQGVYDKIVESLALASTDTVLEIGPGKGILTQKIAPHVKKLIAVEIDTELCAHLAKDLKSFPNTTVVNQDILMFDMQKHFANERIKAVGNIPYYISTSIIEFLMAHLHTISIMHLMLQREFAQRVVAAVGSPDRSSLSCYVQYYTEPKTLFYVKKGSFRPMPKIDSAFVRLVPRAKPAVSVDHEIFFFKVIRASFMHRRKTLRNSLDGVVSQQYLSEFFKKFSVDQNIRPQCLTLQDFANLSNYCLPKMAL